MTVTNDIKKQRLLRMTISHYKNEECSEEEMHRFATEEHAVNAAKIHIRHGMEAYGIVSQRCLFRTQTRFFFLNSSSALSFLVVNFLSDARKHTHGT